MLVDAHQIPRYRPAAWTLWSVINVPTDSLLAKAQRYATKMHEQSREHWEFGFWSALCLEMIVRAAVARSSRALLADAKDVRIARAGARYRCRCERREHGGRPHRHENHNAALEL